MLLLCVIVAATLTTQPSTAPTVGHGPLVSAAWLSAHLKDADISILHVGRDRAGYDAGHIPGARFVALGDIVVTRDAMPNELPPASHLARVFETLGIGDTGPIVIYGDDHGLLAGRLFVTLDYVGHGHRASLLDGGLVEWRRSGRTVTSEPPPLTSRPFRPRINPDVIVTLAHVRDISWSLVSGAGSGWTLVDARPDAQFSGSEPGEGVTRPGHIPGASGLFWEKTLVSSESPLLRPEAELRKMMEEAGARKGTRVVTYCRTGVQASFAYFVAKYLGYDVKMYDASYIEWSRAADAEVARSK